MLRAGLLSNGRKVTFLAKLKQNEISRSDVGSNNFKVNRQNDFKKDMKTFVV